MIEDIIMREKSVKARAKVLFKIEQLCDFGVGLLGPLPCLEMFH